MAKKRPPSRPQRWMDACATAKEAVNGVQEKIDEYKEKVEAYIEEKKQEIEGQIQEWQQELQDSIDTQAIADGFEELKAVQEEFQEWYGNMNENLQSGPTGEKLSALCDMDFNQDFDLNTD